MPIKYWYLVHVIEKSYKELVLYGIFLFLKIFNFLHVWWSSITELESSTLRLGKLHPKDRNISTSRKVERGKLGEEKQRDRDREWNFSQHFVFDLCWFSRYLDIR